MPSPILIVDDAQPGTGLWRIFENGGVAEVRITMTTAEIEALTPDTHMTLAHLQNREPYEIYEIAKCKECDGKGYHEGLCVMSGEWEDGVWTECAKRPFVGADLDDVRGLKRGEFVGNGVTDCPECDERGLAVVSTGRYAMRDELLTPTLAMIPNGPNDPGDECDHA